MLFGFWEIELFYELMENYNQIVLSNWKVLSNLQQVSWTL